MHPNKTHFRLIFLPIIYSSVSWTKANMKINSVLKQYFTEAILKSCIRWPSQKHWSPQFLRLSLEQISKIFPIAPHINIRSLNIANMPVEEIRPQDKSTQLIFHIHGGAFFLGSLTTHRALMSEIAVRTQMQVLHIDYPLAPEHPFPAALDGIYAVYRELLAQGIQAKDIIVSGDSCGANLALALALKLKQLDAVNMPSALMLLSPFLDLSLTSESLRYNQKHDALLSIQALETGIAYYVPSGEDVSRPEYSPLYADLTGLPPTLVQVGSKEILLDDAQRFRDKARAAGVKVDFKLYTGMWHNFQMFSAWFDEAKQAIADLAYFAHKIDRD